MRLASYVPEELIPCALSGSIPELPHVAKVPKTWTVIFSVETYTSESRY